MFIRYSWSLLGFIPNRVGSLRFLWSGYEINREGIEEDKTPLYSFLSAKTVHQQLFSGNTLQKLPVDKVHNGREAFCFFKDFYLLVCTRSFLQQFRNEVYSISDA